MSNSLVFFFRLIKWWLVVYRMQVLIVCKKMSFLFPTICDIHNYKKEKEKCAHIRTPSQNVWTLNGLPIRRKKKKTQPGNPRQLIPRGYTFTCVFMSVPLRRYSCVYGPPLLPRSHVARTCFSGSCARADQPVWCLSVFFSFVFLSVVCFCKLEAFYGRCC